MVCYYIYLYMYNLISPEVHASGLQLYAERRI